MHYEEYKKVKQKEEIKLPSKQLIPNSMQQAFISNLRKLRNENESKSLLISATGTGELSQLAQVSKFQKKCSDSINKAFLNTQC